MYNNLSALLSHVISCLLLLAAVALCSCEGEEARLEPVPYLVVDSIYPATELTFRQVVDTLLGQSVLVEEALKDDANANYSKKIDMAELRSRKYNAHVVTYHTTDPNGQPVIASGVVYYPKTGKPRGVIEALSFNKNKYDYPSGNLANIEVIQGMAGFVILVADQIGSGATGNMAFPYLYHENIAKVCADLRLAATELVRNVYGRAMPSWSMISGFSLAAFEAWGLARYYGKHPELGVDISEVWMSGGLYNSLAVLDYQLRTQHTEYAFIPNVICSLNHYENLELDLHQVFRGELSKHYHEWCTGYMRLADVSVLLGPDVGEYLNMDFFSDANPDYQRLRTAIQQRLSIPNDWVPACQVHIYHGREDTYVPIDGAEELVAYLRSVGAHVDYVETEGDHQENALAMAEDMLSMLYK